MGGERTFLSMNLDRPQSLSYFVPCSTTMNLPFVIWRSKPKLASVRIRQKYFQSRWLFHRRTKASRYRLMSAVGIALMDWWCVYIDIAKAGLVVMAELSKWWMCNVQGWQMVWHRKLGRAWFWIQDPWFWVHNPQQQKQQGPQIICVQVMSTSPSSSSLTHVYNPHSWRRSTWQIRRADYSRCQLNIKILNAFPCWQVGKTYFIGTIENLRFVFRSNSGREPRISGSLVTGYSQRYSTIRS